jgi:hypothetical protein
MPGTSSNFCWHEGAGISQRVHGLLRSSLFLFPQWGGAGVSPAADKVQKSIPRASVSKLLVGEKHAQRLKAKACFLPAAHE